jgi:DNA-binding transcriptional ArsR family regulator
MSPKRDTKDDLPPALRALADPTRLKIMLMLEGRERTVGEIVEFFDLSQPTISRHLQTLTTAGLVKRRKRAQRVYYGINSDSVRDVCISLAACFPCCCQEIGDGSIGVQAIVVESPARGRKSARSQSKKPKSGGKDR